MSKVYIILFLLFFLSVVGCRGAPEDVNMDLQRVTVYTANPDNSIECHTTIMILNPHDYDLTNNSFFITKRYLFLPGTVSNLSVWDSRWGLHLIGNSSSAEEAYKEMDVYKDLGVPFAVAYDSEIGDGYMIETVAAGINNVDLISHDVLFLKMQFNAENYIKDFGFGTVPYYGETHPEFENYSLFTIVEGSTSGQTPQLNITKDELYVSLPYDEYNYTDSISSIPYYDEINYNGEKVILKWDLSKLDYSSTNGIFRIIYQVHENKIKRNVDSAALNSLELIKRADKISNISFAISLISLFLALKPIDWKAVYSKKERIENAINRFIYGDYKGR